MTQEEAIIKALEEYGGRASNKQIYERAMKYVQFGGATPEATIRWWLQKSKHIKPTEGKRGWWELISYQEEIAKLKAIIRQRDQEILELKEKCSPSRCVTLEQIEADIMDCPDWQTAKSRIDDINRSGVLAETDWAKVAKKIQKAFKQKQQQLLLAQAEVFNKVANKPTSITASSVSISNPSLQKQDLNFQNTVGQVVGHADKIETNKED